MSPLQKARFGQTQRYFEISTFSFTRVNSDAEISKSLDFDQILTFKEQTQLYTVKFSQKLSILKR